MSLWKMCPKSQLPFCMANFGYLYNELVLCKDNTEFEHVA